MRCTLVFTYKNQLATIHAISRARSRDRQSPLESHSRNTSLAFLQNFFTGRNFHIIFTRMGRPSNKIVMNRGRASKINKIKVERRLLPSDSPLQFRILRSEFKEKRKNKCREIYFQLQSSISQNYTFVYIFGNDSITTQAILMGFGSF